MGEQRIELALKATNASQEFMRVVIHKSPRRGKYLVRIWIAINSRTRIPGLSARSCGWVSARPRRFADARRASRLWFGFHDCELNTNLRFALLPHVHRIVIGRP